MKWRMFAVQQGIGRGEGLKAFSGFCAVGETPLLHGSFTSQHLREFGKVLSVLGWGKEFVSLT